MNMANNAGIYKEKETKNCWLWMMLNAFKRIAIQVNSSVNEVTLLQIEVLYALC